MMISIEGAVLALVVFLTVMLVVSFFDSKGHIHHRLH
jgi:hypothetical protein